MQHVPITKRSLRLLMLSYVSALILIVLLLVSAQALIQSTLIHEEHIRAVASAINSQELRDQRMFSEMILLQNPPGNGTDYLAIARFVASDEQQWEAVGEALYNGDSKLSIFPSDFSATSNAVLAREKSAWLAMRKDYRDLLALEARDHPASPDLARPYVDLIYLADAPYLHTLVEVYQDLVASADQEVVHVQLVEIALFALSLLVISIEALAVVRPAIAQLRAALDYLAAIVPKGGD